MKTPAQTSTPTGQDQTATTDQSTTDGGAGVTPAPESTETTTEPSSGGDAKPTGMMGSLDDPKPETETKTEPATTDSGKPEQSDEGELVLNLPEGLTVNETTLNEFKKVAKEAGLNAESASAVAGWYAKYEQDAAKEVEQQMEADDVKWVKEITDDPDLGGEKLESSKRDVVKALRHFGGQKLVDDLVALRLDNLPSLFRAFATVGKAMGEDKSGLGGAGSDQKPTQPSEEQRLAKLYPKMAAEYSKQGRNLIDGS